MNIDGEHLSYEQVHEILNWRLFSSSLLFSRLFVLLLQQRTPVSLALPTIIIVIVDVHLSFNGETMQRDFLV